VAIKLREEQLEIGTVLRCVSDDGDTHTVTRPPRVVIWGEVIMALNAESAQDWTPPVRPLIPRMKRKAFGT